MTDKSLIARAASGDDRIREIIYEKYYHHVYRYCVYRTGSLHDAEDLAQETFLRLYRYTDLQHKNTKAYVLKVACNVCNSYFAGRGADQPLDESIPAGMEVDEEQQAVRRAVAALPDDMRQVIILYYYNDLKLSHIAEILSVPLSTVKTRLRRGRQKLKQILIQEGSVKVASL